MNMRYLDKNALKPGDIVGIPYSLNLGWKSFRYMKIIPKVIKRITPARTKFIMEDGAECNKYVGFYPITDETERQNKIVSCAENINSALFSLDRLHRDNKILTKNDETIVKVSGMLDELMKVLQEASDA